MGLHLERLAQRISAVRKWLLGGGGDRASYDYRQAYEEWKKRNRDLGVRLNASQRFPRDEAHER